MERTKVARGRIRGTGTPGEEGKRQRERDRGGRNEDQERNEEAASLTGKINSGEPANPTRPTLSPLSPLRSYPLLFSPPQLPLCPQFPPCNPYLRLALGVEPEPTHPHDCPGVPSLFHPSSPSLPPSLRPSFIHHPLLVLLCALPRRR